MGNRQSYRGRRNPMWNRAGYLLRGHCPGGAAGMPHLRAAVARILTCTKLSRVTGLHESKSELP